MLKLETLSLYQFKNYHQRQFIFREKIAGIHGKNGVGKTNLLDAIHYLCFTKSYFSRLDMVNVQHGQAGFRLEGVFERLGKREQAVCILRESGRKEFSVNGDTYEKFSQHIGRYPCVVIAPDDVQMIIGASEERRGFIDMLLSQLSAEYLQQLITYNRVLQQRNSLLRSFAESPAGHDMSLLDVLDEQLAQPGERILSKRRDFLVGFLPLVKKIYNEIARQYEDITLFYETALSDDGFLELLKAYRQKDLAVQRTTCGVHRDDLEFNIGARNFKTVASQGQRKSLLFALKLAELEVLKNEKGFEPILLLDDVFEKLDEDRVANLLQRVCVENQGQVFITDTNGQRLDDHLKLLGMPFELLELK